MAMSSAVAVGASILLLRSAMKAWDRSVLFPVCVSVCVSLIFIHRLLREYICLRCIVWHSSCGTPV